MQYSRWQTSLVDSQSLSLLRAVTSKTESRLKVKASEQLTTGIASFKVQGKALRQNIALPPTNLNAPSCAPAKRAMPNIAIIYK